MLSKNEIKFIRSLQQKKYRREEGLFVAEGTKIVQELLGSGLKVKNVFGLANWMNEHAEDIKKANAVGVAINRDLLKKISSMSTPHEVLCIAEIPRHKLEFEIIRRQFSLCLDKVQDPGNLGTIIRVADWFGIENVFCSNDCADAYNPKVIQSTMGSVSRVKLHYLDLNDLIKELKINDFLGKTLLKEHDFKVFAAVLDGKSLYEVKLPQQGLLILGNESAGVSKELYDNVDEKVAISGFGNAESLNVATAAAIFCYEFRRQYK